MVKVVQIMANNSSVPYFNWFAEEVQKHKDLRFTFIALYSELPQMIDDMAERGCECLWVKYNSSKRKSNMIEAVFALAKVLKKIKPDVVHTHLFDDSLPGLLAAKLAGVKKRVITKADTTFHWYNTPIWVWADRFNNFNATHLIAPTQECADFVINCEKASPSKVKIIHHGIPMKKSTNQIAEIKQHLIEKYDLTDKLVIGTISRLIEWKGYKHIIDAVEIIVEKYPKCHFLFTGTGSQKNELIDLIKQKSLENHITFTDWIDPSHIPSLYGIMDIYLHAAKFEPFGFVIAEAMMNGVPVVSTETGAAKDAIIHKENGYLVSYNNIVVELAEGIEYMIQNDRKAIGIKGKETALNMYEFKTMFSKHKKLYLDEKIS